MAHAPLPPIQHFDGHAPRPQHHAHLHSHIHPRLPSVDAHSSSSIMSTSGAAAGAPLLPHPPPPSSQHYNIPPPHLQPHHHPPSVASNAVPLPLPPFSSPTSYAYHDHAATMHVPGAAAAMRHPLAQHVSMERSMSGGRHKKEIRRRTKTGCLTCRKRRIKCDEGHPTCRNCSKSKRECLGYDPIFKQNSISSSPTDARAHLGLIPSPSHQHLPPPPSLSAIASSSTTLPPAHTLPSSSSHHPHYPLIAVSGSGAHPTYLPTPPPWPAYIPPSVRDSHGPYASLSISLDPALAGDHHHNHNLPGMGAFHHSSPSLLPARKVVSISMEDLFSLHDVPPQFQRRDPPPALSPDMQQAVADFYRYHFAPGLDRFLDTEWYTQESLFHLQQHASLHDFVSQCVLSFRARTTDVHVERAIASLEARLIWQLACLPRIAARGLAGREPSVQELLPRLDVLENLLTGQFLEPHRAPLAPQPVAESEAHQKAAIHKQQTFWFQLGRFVSARDDVAGDARATQDIEAALDAIRDMLGQEEAHDVLYSLAIGRHIGGRVVEFVPPHPFEGAALTNDPADKINRLRVAYAWLENEVRDGTTQVVKAVCSMALRSWALHKRGGA